MKQLSVFGFAFVLGVFLALGLLYFNPLTGKRGPLPDSEQWSRYESSGAANLALTHSGQLPLGAHPIGVPQLWESTIDGVVLAIVELRNEDGSLFGFGSRLSMLSEDTELLYKGVALENYWTVSAPGQGSFFVIEEENIWSPLKEIALRGLASGGWTGSQNYVLTSGPLDSGHGLLLGATGEFRGQRGRTMQRYELRHYSAADGSLDLGGELGILPLQPGLAPTASAKP